MFLLKLSLLFVKILSCILTPLELIGAEYNRLPIQRDTRDIVAMAQALGATKFVSYLTTTGLNTTLTGQGPFTVFLPLNDAFEKLSDDMKDNFKDTDFARSILKYHIAPGRYDIIEFQDEEILRSLDQDLSIRINLYEGGEAVTASGSLVSRSDINAKNGVLHVIDRVMVMTPEFGSVAGLLGFPIFRYMYYGMIDGNLTGLLSGSEPITVFAPNDAAFQKLPPDQFKKLYKNSTAIRRLVKNHIVRGTFFTAGMYTGGPLTTLDGQTLQVKIVDGNITVDDAPLLIPDWTCTNGVTHVTGDVFMPPGLLESGQTP
ncbi:transforming growth factor-beta-induced protein ig-h3-like [Pecten maximus]|uniref:transforming growth factor-beta-induced protein ig-h3-like n=1 Tax=Pecten maximus TaxID=6579 RepID=UPI001458AE56|nr:transforming growth factor-beta-induced protein ig-h3-like [Pecten maximus]